MPDIRDPLDPKKIPNTTSTDSPSLKEQLQAEIDDVERAVANRIPGGKNVGEKIQSQLDPIEGKIIDALGKIPGAQTAALDMLKKAKATLQGKTERDNKDPFDVTPRERDDNEAPTTKTDPRNRN